MLTKTRVRDGVAWTLLLGVVAFSVIRTQQTNGDLKDLTIRMAQQAQCTQDFLARTVEVLNTRTNTNPELNKADENRVEAEGRLFGFLTQQFGSQTPQGSDPPPEVVLQYQRLIREYFQSIQDYLVILNRTNLNQQANPFPTKEDYNNCLRMHR